MRRFHVLACTRHGRSRACCPRAVSLWPQLFGSFAPPSGGGGLSLASKLFSKALGMMGYQIGYLQQFLPGCGLSRFSKYRLLGGPWVRDQRLTSALVSTSGSRVQALPGPALGVELPSTKRKDTLSLTVQLCIWMKCSSLVFFPQARGLGEPRAGPPSPRSPPGDGEHLPIYFCHLCKSCTRGAQGAPSVKHLLRSSSQGPGNEPVWPPAPRGACSSLALWPSPLLMCCTRSLSPKLKKKI